LLLDVAALVDIGAGAAEEDGQRCQQHNRHQDEPERIAVL
jgi:hypothetical protein